MYTRQESENIIKKCSKTMKKCSRKISYKIRSGIIKLDF